MDRDDHYRIMRANIFCSMSCLFDFLIFATSLVMLISFQKIPSAVALFSIAMMLALTAIGVGKYYINETDKKKQRSIGYFLFPLDLIKMSSFGIGFAFVVHDLLKLPLSWFLRLFV